MKRRYEGNLAALDKNDETSLMIAIALGNKNKFLGYKTYLKFYKFCNLAALDKNGETSLMIAIALGNKNIFLGYKNIF